MFPGNWNWKKAAMGQRWTNSYFIESRHATPLKATSCHECSEVAALQWRHNDGVSNHPRLDCLLNRLFRSRAKKASQLRFTGLCGGNSPWLVNSPHKGPVTRKMFPFDDVIMSTDRAINVIMEFRSFRDQISKSVFVKNNFFTLLLIALWLFCQPIRS